MFLSRTCTISGIVLLTVLFAEPSVLCSVPINIVIGLAFGAVGILMVKQGSGNGWIIVAAAALLFLSNYPALLKCKQCCYISKVIFSIMLLLGGEKNIFHKIKVSSKDNF